MAEVPPANFVVGQVYHRRRDLHGAFSGQQQGGISTPVARPFILLFTGDSGHQYGYRDDFQSDGTYWYTGEGQRGDMRMKGGNLAILNHQAAGKELHLFESLGNGLARYVGVASYLGHHWETRPDKEKRLRQAIIFELEVNGDVSAGAAAQLEAEPLEREEKRLWKTPLEELRARALEGSMKAATSEDKRQRVYERSRAVKVYVLRRADGKCEGCGSSAPFKTAKGKPYLEPHHIRRVADEGPDHPRWVAALCPNCHRKIHYGVGGAQYNEEISERIAQLEA